jgi:hypothetical protein
MTFKRSFLFLFILSIFLLACQPTTTSTPSRSTPLGLPSTQTVAPSPQATATFESTATPLPPAPRDFTEEFDSASPYWSTFGTNNFVPDVQLQNGFLVFNLTQTNDWADSIYNAQDYQDVRVDAQVEVRNGNDGTVGIVCRYSQTKGWYEFNIYADQTYMLMYGQWLAPGIARYTPLHRVNSEKIKAGTNQIGLVCQGDTLTPYINNVRMPIYEDNKVGLKDGNIGVTASSFADVPFVAAFDWVKVSTPPVTP